MNQKTRRKLDLIMRNLIIKILNYTQDIKQKEKKYQNVENRSI